MTELFFVPEMLKAMPSEEGGRRFLYIEASNENRDYQRERILAKALANSAQYFQRYGFVDLEHIAQVGPKKGIPNYQMFEIGRPVDVRADEAATFVKAEIYSGATPVAANANMFWSSITELKPPQRWYPSVAGSVLEKDEATGTVSKVRWTSIGLSKTPVNLNVPTVSVTPFGPLAKSLDAAADAFIKALDAGYGTDSATLAAGGALRRQSLDRRVQSYWDFRDAMSADLRAGKVAPNPVAMLAHAHKRHGVDQSDGADWVHRLLGDIGQDVLKRRAPTPPMKKALPATRGLTNLTEALEASRREFAAAVARVGGRDVRLSDFLEGPPKERPLTIEKAAGQVLKSLQAGQLTPADADAARVALLNARLQGIIR